MRDGGVPRGPGGPPHQMNRPVLFVAADPRECASWVAKWSDVRPLHLPVHWARRGKWLGVDMIAIANGAGWDRANAAVLSMVEKPRAVFNIGFCGALDPALGIGDVFVADEVRSGALSYAASPPLSKAAVRSGALASVSQIAQTAAEKKKLHETGMIVVEMEAAGVARASEQLGVQFYCVRAVSDLADED